MVNEEYKYAALTALIIRCAMAVHKAPGNGFQEVIYQRALALEMRAAGITTAQELGMPVYFRNERIGTRP